MAIKSLLNQDFSRATQKINKFWLEEEDLDQMLSHSHFNK
jgi:hypothetical protein